MNSDGLTRLRNAQSARHSSVRIRGNKMLKSICEILRERGYIESFEEDKKDEKYFIQIILKYTGRGEPVIRRVVRMSKSNRRMYVNASRIPRFFGGYATVILSTSLGVMTGKQAMEKNVGGEVICYVL